MWKRHVLKTYPRLWDITQGEKEVNNMVIKEFRKENAIHIPGESEPIPDENLSY